MRGPRRKKHERERDLARISELYLQGHTHEQIARIIGEEFYQDKAVDFGVTPENFLTRRTIGNDIKTIEERFRQAVIGDIATLKGQELAKLGLIEREAWEGWKRSIGQAVTTTTREGGKNGQETTVRTEDLAGDPRFPQVILQAIEKRCKLMGLDAPLKLSIDEIDAAIEGLIGAARGLAEMAPGGEAPVDGASPGEGQEPGKG